MVSHRAASRLHAPINIAVHCIRIAPQTITANVSLTISTDHAQSQRSNHTSFDRRKYEFSERDAADKVVLRRNTLWNIYRRVVQL